MEKENIRIKKAIVHILDSTVGLPVLSDEIIDNGSDFSDFLREHIYRITSGDDIKKCEFIKEESEMYKYLQSYNDELFVESSKNIAALLFQIMNSNIDIPQADLVVVRFSYEGRDYLGLLKMNYKASYTHKTIADGLSNINDIIKYKSILPGETQRLQEAAVIDLQNQAIILIEKKYDINGVKTNYFSQLFLKCAGSLSHKAKLAIVTKAVENVQKANYDETEQFEVQMKAKSIINSELNQNGGFHIPDVANKIFAQKPELKKEFTEKLEKYNIANEEILPQNEKTTKKYQKQHLTTDTGIEIKIPMDQYDNPGCVEFITNADGTISVLLKNIGHLTSIF